MRLTTRAAIIALAFALVLAACGDDDGTTDTSPAPTAAASTESTATGATAAASTTAASPTGGGTDFGDLQARYESTPLRLTYVSGEDTDQVEIVLAQDPTATPPVESITLVGEDTKIIITGDTTVLCDSGACFEIPGATGEGLVAGLLGPFGALLALGPDGPLGASVGEEPITVAGRRGVCYTYTPPSEVGADTDLFRQCVDGDLGFTLLLQSSQTGSDELTTIMEVTDVSDPSPEDFEPTGPVTPTP